MVYSVQLVLILVIGILTILLVVLGIQVYFILKEVRRTIGKANKVLDTAGSITESVSIPISSLSQLVTGLKAGSIISVAKFIKNMIGKDDDDSDKKRNNE